MSPVREREVARMVRVSAREIVLPQIFSGASSSRRIGWLRKISRDLMQSPRISASVSWTFLPGREPRTGRRFVFVYFTATAAANLRVDEILCCRC